MLLPVLVYVLYLGTHFGFGFNYARVCFGLTVFVSLLLMSLFLKINFHACLLRVGFPLV